MSLGELLTVLPPPADVVASVGDWRVIEAQIGVALPSDYKEFVSLYGVGSVRESIWILSPYSSTSLYSRNCKNIEVYTPS